MDINVFDHFKNVVMIQFKDVISVKRIDRRLCYITEDGVFYGAINLKEQALLYASLGCIQIDKNSLININKIERIEGRSAIVRGAKYSVSRRILPKLIKKFKG